MALKGEKCVLYVTQAEEITLSGQQKEQHVVVNLSKDTLKLGEKYTIGKGNSLTLTGACEKGTIKTSTDSAFYLTIADGTLYIGDSPHVKKETGKKKKKKRKSYKGKKRKKKPLKNLDSLPTITCNTIFVISDSGNNDSTIEINNVHFNIGRFLAYRIKNFNFTSALVTGFKFEQIKIFHVNAYNSGFYNCLFNPGDGNPVTSRENIHFDSCSFGTGTRIDLHLLWGMTKCDLQKGVMRYDTTNWPKKIPKTPTSVHYGDKQMAKIIANSLKKYKAFRRSKVSRPLFKGLSKHLLPQ